MAPQWTIEEDRALLLSLVQVMAPNGPSKHQFDGAREILKDRWTLSAITQHYNKKLRLLAPSTMGSAGTGSTPATPVKSATKRKAPASASKAAAASASTSPAPATKGRGRKKAAAKAVKEEPVDEAGDDDEGREDDEGGEKTPTKKAKVAESTEEE